MQDVGYALMLLTVVAFSASIVFKNISRLNAVKKTKSWAAAEGTVRSGSVDVVRHLRFGDIQLPVFELSYVVGEKAYSERFALSMFSEPVDSLMSRMVGRKITVQYDPANPGICYLPGEKIEGCRIEQNLGDQVRFYARE
jgi:hypothetical protein